MKPIRAIGRLAWILSGPAAASLAFGTTSPAAFAYRPPPSGGDAGPARAHHCGRAACLPCLARPATRTERKP
jgi:hypothetical protein